MSAAAPPDALELIRRWDGIGVVSHHDEPTGAWMFVALHDDTLGRPTGGCRMKVYDAPEDGLRDAQRLSEGMTRKWATVGLPFGGGKAVLAVPRVPTGEAREGLLRRFGELLNSLQGAFSTGEDLGTTPADMLVVSGVTPWVTATDPATGELLDPGPWTALGVHHGIVAALADRTGSGTLRGRSVLVQGVGDVGAPLARSLSAAGATLLVSDVDGARAASLAEELGASLIAPGDVYDTECDVYAPCAVGATLSRATIPRLRCRIVAGSANNQLERAEDAERLKEQGVLYAPDYVINVGGAMALGLKMNGLDDEAEVRRRVEGIGAILSEIFEEARERGESPVASADRRVERTLGQGG